MYKSILFLTLAFLASSASAESKYINEYKIKKAEIASLKEELINEKCSKIKDRIKEFNCNSETREEASEKYPSRTSEVYMKKKYGDLSKEEINKHISRLKKEGLEVQLNGDKLDDDYIDLLRKIRLEISMLENGFY